MFSLKHFPAKALKWSRITARSSFLVPETLLNYHRIPSGSRNADTRKFSTTKTNISAEKNNQRYYSNTKKSLEAVLALGDEKWNASHQHLFRRTPSKVSPPIPNYLLDNYWWAYVNPTMIRTLDKNILVNMLLLGNFPRLRDAAIDELGSFPDDDGVKRIKGRTLQATCCYSDLTENLARRLAPDSSLDVVDVVPDQLENAERKLYDVHHRAISLSCCNVETLPFEDASFDQVLYFFLFHEIPTYARLRVLEEATRVLKPGGKIVFVDYHRPESSLWRIVTKFQFFLYEPFAMDMWTTDISEWLPKKYRKPESQISIRKELFFSGVFQKTVVVIPNLGQSEDAPKPKLHYNKSRSRMSFEDGPYGFFDSPTDHEEYHLPGNYTLP